METYGYIYNSLTGVSTKVGGRDEKRTGAYEGTTAASDDEGNILFYSDGRQVFNAESEAVIYGGLLAGNEGHARHSSAAQGVITVRHPLDPDNYHVFTVDDALAPIYGCNHFVLNKDGSLKNGPTRLGSYNTFEGIAATKHSNGVDIWVMVMSMQGEFNAYLVTSNGINLEKSNLFQAKAYSIYGDRLRGSLAFSWDGSKMAITHPASWPTAERGLMLYDFNNSTGELSNKMEIAPNNQVLGGYDLIFSPDNKRIFVSSIGFNLSYVDISSGVESQIISSFTRTSLPTRLSNLEIGADGKLYYGSADGLQRIDVDVNTQTPTSSVSVTGEYHRSISNIYLQPSEKVQITSLLDTVCSEWREYDLNVIWECSGKSAENHSLISDTANGYFGAGITNRERGLFNPDGLSDGIYEVVFKMGNISDTLSITVETCDEVTCQIWFDTQITQDGMEITVAHESAGPYKWYDCDNNNELIDSLTTRTVTVAPGNYKVEMSEGANCYAISDCFTVAPVSSNDISGKSITIFPNPADATLSIQNSNKGEFTYEIVSLLGESIMKNTSSSKGLTIDVQDLVPGTYFVKISNEDGIVRTIPISKK